LGIAVVILLGLRTLSNNPLLSTTLIAYFPRLLLFLTALLAILPPVLAVFL